MKNIRKGSMGEPESDPCRHARTGAHLNLAARKRNAASKAQLSVVLLSTWPGTASSARHA
jgi:hypothetical protein